MTGVLLCLIPPAEAEPRTPPGPLGDPLLDAIWSSWRHARARTRCWRPGST